MDNNESENRIKELEKRVEQLEKEAADHRPRFEFIGNVFREARQLSD